MGNIPKSLKTVLTMKACDENKNSCAYGICVEREKTTRIIFVSPDVIYPADFIQTMCETCDKNPDCIIYGNKNRSVSGGILVKPELLSNSVVDTNNVSDISKWISDNFGNKFIVCPEL
jgi:hypothetical protein